MCVAEMPKRSSSSSGLPLRGISRTARRFTVSPALGDRVGHRIADAARRVVILDCDDDAARRLAGGDRGLRDRRAAREYRVDHADRRCPAAFSWSYAFSASNTVTPAPTTVATSARALAQHLQAADRERLVVAVDDRRLRAGSCACTPGPGDSAISADELLGADAVARIEHRDVRLGAAHREILERHLRRAVFADRHARVRCRPS